MTSQAQQMVLVLIAPSIIERKSIFDRLQHTTKLILVLPRATLNDAFQLSTRTPDRHLPPSRQFDMLVCIDPKLKQGYKCNEKSKHLAETCPAVFYHLKTWVSQS